MLPAILICAFMVKNVATQRTATATLGTTKSCVLIGDDVKLLCTVSADCCSSFVRIWEKGSAINLLNNGVSTLDPSKYEEDFDNGTTGFNLIIKNVQKSDLVVNYKCLYGATESAQFYLDGILCPSSDVNISGGCWKCAGQDYGWAFLGTVFGTVTIMIIATGFIKIIAKVKIGDLKTVWKVGVLTFIISAVVNILIAVPIGYLVCHCVDGKAPWFIVLGLVTYGITGVIALIFMLRQGSSQGSNGSNEPPLEKKKKKKPAAETRSRSATTGAKHIKTANNETEMIPTKKGFSGDLEKKRPLPPLTNQPSPTNRPLPLPSSTRPLPSSTRPLPQITTNKGDN